MFMLNERFTVWDFLFENISSENFLIKISMNIAFYKH